MPAPRPARARNRSAPSSWPTSSSAWAAPTAHGRSPVSRRPKPPPRDRLRARSLSAHGARRGGGSRLATEGQIEAARDDDPDQPAQIRAAEKLGGDRPLQRADEAVFYTPAGNQARDEGDDPGPVDVTVGALLRLAIELVDVDLTATLDEEVCEHDTRPRAHPQQQADHPVVEGLRERWLEHEIDGDD